MQSKFSVFHTAAVALLDGDGGMVQYGDERVRNPVVLALRDKVQVSIVDAFRKEQCEATVVIAGKSYHATIEHASGTADNPLSDEGLALKFFANAERVVGRANAQRISELVNDLESLPDMAALTRLCA